GQQIVDIEVVGNRRISKDDVLAYLHEKTGERFTPEVLAQDVRELWTSGFFDDIEGDLERTDAGVRLRFVVREKPSVAKVEFEGNDELEAEGLAEAIEVKVDTIRSPAAIGRSIQKIRDMYPEKG